MIRDTDVLRLWLHIATWSAAAGTNAVVIIYAFSNWRSRMLGRLFMLQGVAFAVAVDVAVLFGFWRPSDIAILLWVGIVLYFAIAISTMALAILIFQMNHIKGRKIVIVQFTGKVYDFLKKTAQIYLPAAGTLYFAIAQIWGLPAAEEVTGTIVAVDAFLGVILGISQSSYNNSDARFGGTLAIEDHEDGSALRLRNVDNNALLNQDEITFKILHAPMPDPVPLVSKVVPPPQA